MNATSLKREERENQRVIEWNKLNPEGTPVNVEKDDGSIFPTKTRSEAWLLGRHTAVILVDGIAGGFALQRVTVRE